jgi:ketosteroid isomerase-like protein
MITPEQAQHIAQEWVDVWNSHDLERILTHYADPLEFTSPLIVKRLGRADGTIHSKAELKDYFTTGITSALRFELLEAIAGVSSVAVRYRNQRGMTVIEVMRLNAQGKADRVVVHYSAAV